MLSGSTETLLREGLAQWIDYMISGKSEKEIDEIEEEIVKARTVNEKIKLVRRIKDNIEQVEESIRTAGGKWTIKDAGATTVASIVTGSIVGGLFLNYLRRRKITNAEAEGKLERHLNELLRLKAKAEAIRVEGERDEQNRAAPTVGDQIKQKLQQPFQQQGNQPQPQPRPQPQLQQAPPAPSVNDNQNFDEE